MKTNFSLSFINDEVGPGIAEMLSFSKESGVKNIELRSIDGVNLLDLSLTKVQELAKIIRENDLNVIGIASPIFKWYAEKESTIFFENTDNFGFTTHLPFERKQEYISRVIDYAKILGAQFIRIFSLLVSAEEKDMKLFAGYERDLLTMLKLLGDRNDIQIVLENDPVSYFTKRNDVIHFSKVAKEFEIGLLLDIGNSYFGGDPLQVSDMIQVAPFVQHVHVKDFSSSTGKYVPMGRGDIPYKDYLSELAKSAKKELFLSIETFSSGDKYKDSLESMKVLEELINL